MSDASFIEIVILAAVAAFFVFKLRSVLGKRTGHEERPKFDPFRQAEERSREAEEKVIRLPDRGGERDKADRHLDEEELIEESGDEAAEAEIADTPLDAALTQIKLADPRFAKDEFLGTRKGVVYGKRVSARVVLGGRRLIKKNKE